MARGGQVFFIHNRIESIFSMANLIQRLVPEARVVIGHGQMGEHILEKAMLDFMAHKADVLLSTTIVENGIDIPNANTMIISRADRYGLSQLYQLRGRVGRSDRPAYAYLLIPPEEALSPVARKRLSAIKEFSDLGSGFRVAALDLEIRGAGNLLGGEQSGQIDAVGFEMYTKLLEETIRELKGEDLEDDVRATVNLRIDFRIDERYVPDMNQRLMIYRRIAAARSEEELNRIMEEVRDRYGPPPLGRAQSCRLRPHSRARRWSGHREYRPGRNGRRPPLPGESQSRSRPCRASRARPRRPAADPAGFPQDGHEKAPDRYPRCGGSPVEGGSRPSAGSVRFPAARAIRARVVDGEGDGWGSDSGVFEGRDFKGERRGSSRTRRHPRARRRPPGRPSGVRWRLIGRAGRSVVG